MQLDGTLDTFPLRELIEMVVYSSVTGVLELRVGDHVAQLFFRDGHPYHAVIQGHEGMQAVCTMFEQRDAPFRFVADAECAATTLWIDPWEMIGHAEEVARLWASVRAHIPGLDWVPALVFDARTPQVHISETVWPVLAAVDGQRNVAAIAEHLNLMPLDTCIALVSLLDQGLIVLRRPLPTRLAPHSTLLAPPERAADTPTARPNPPPGFLERLLAEAQSQDEAARPDLTDEEIQERQRIDRYVSDR